MTREYAEDMFVAEHIERLMEENVALRCERNELARELTELKTNCRIIASLFSMTNWPNVHSRGIVAGLGILEAGSPGEPKENQHGKQQQDHYEKHGRWPYRHELGDEQEQAGERRVDGAQAGGFGERENAREQPAPAEVVWK